MEKYIAFNVYSRNEHGAAVAVGDRDGVEKDVYLAKDVDERIAKLEQALKWYADAEPVELHTKAEIEEYQSRAKQSLMESRP